MSTGGIGVTIGSNSQKTTDKTQTLSNVGSTIGSLGGNVTLDAGNQLNIHGSEVIANKDISLKGSDVAITAAENHLSQQHTTESKQSGITVALSGAAGSAINSAVTTAQDAKKRPTGGSGHYRPPKLCFRAFRRPKQGCLPMKPATPMRWG